MKRQVKRIFSMLLATLLAVMPLAINAGAYDYDGHWAEEFIETARERKWMNGDPDGSFRPNDSINRAEFSSMLWESLGLEEQKGENPFKDVKEGDWFYKVAVELYNANIVSGYGDGIFAPDDLLTREMAFTMLANAFKLKANDGKVIEKFTDYAQISAWAVEPANALVEKNYVSGKGGGRLAPKEPLSRGEMATILVITYDGENEIEIEEPEKKDNIFYVSSDGSDSNDGMSEETPWRTLEKVSGKRYKPGDKVLFKKGDKFTGTVRFKGTGSKAEPIEIGSYGDGGARPVLNGEGAKTNRKLYADEYSDISGTLEILEGDYWHITGLEITNYLNDSGEKLRSGILALDTCKDSKEYENTPQYGLTIDNCYIHRIASDDAEKRTGGIIIMGNYNDVLVDNNIIEDVGITGIRNVSLNPHAFGGNHTKFYHQNYKISNNKLRNIVGDCVVLSSVENGLMEYNYVDGYCIGDPEKDYAALWTWACRDVTIQYNEVTGGGSTVNDGTPFDVDYYNTNILIQYNYTHNNYKGIAMFTINSTGSVFRHNISINDGKRADTALFPYQTMTEDEAPLMYGNFIYQSKNLPRTNLFNNYMSLNNLYVKFFNNHVISGNHLRLTAENRINRGIMDGNVFLPGSIITDAGRTLDSSVYQSGNTELAAGVLGIDDIAPGTEPYGIITGYNKFDTSRLEDFDGLEKILNSTDELEGVDIEEMENHWGLGGIPASTEDFFGNEH